MKTCGLYSKMELISHLGYIAFLSFFGIFAALSTVFAFSNLSCPEDAISAVVTLVLSVMILAVDFFECKALGVRMYMDEKGIGIRSFGKTKNSLSWNDIREVGMGKMQTVFGSKSCVYFCDRKLEEKEKSDLVTLQYETVSFSHIPKNWYSSICEKLPVSMPDEIREEGIR